MEFEPTEFFDEVARIYMKSLGVSGEPDHGSFDFMGTSLTTLDDREYGPREFPLLPPLRAVFHCKGCGLSLRSSNLQTAGDLYRAITYNELFRHQHRTCLGSRLRGQKKDEPEVWKQVRDILEEERERESGS